MLKLVQQSNGWEAKYQAAIRELESREARWQEIECLLRNAIERLSIVARGVEPRLDSQLQIIDQLSRDKRNEKLAQALQSLGQIFASLNGSGVGQKHRRSDPVLLMLELLKGIHFDDAQRQQLRIICSDLLMAVASDYDRDSVNHYVAQLSSLINENFDAVDASPKSSRIVFQLLELLDLDEVRKTAFESRYRGDELCQPELEELASLINAQLGDSPGDPSTDSVMIKLLDRLAIVQGASGISGDSQSRVSSSLEAGDWMEVLNEIVNSVSATLKKLNQDKRELESFIVSVTDQLGEITQVIAADQTDHQSDHEDTNCLHAFVQDGMALIQRNFYSSNDIGELKSEVSRNIDTIRGGVEDFVDRINLRHVATEERNIRLSQQLSKMEQETQELQTKLIENREKLLYDALTGVRSRLAYDEHIGVELARWNRYATPFSYAIVDVDHFKNINDGYGHAAGDKALRIIAQLMADSIRKSDYVFRIGGEEFVLIFTNTDIEQASILIESLRLSISRSDIHFKKQRLQLTVSVGITEARRGDDVDSIYQRADRALYEAKNGGRDCQVVAN